MRRIGSDAEDLAAEYLIDQGFTIVTRRHKTRSGELDLVALDGNELVFVEVKQRKAGYIPEESISRLKIDRLFSAANEYRRANGIPETPFRFDVVAVGADGIRHHRGAFRDLVDLSTDEYDCPDPEVED